MNLMQDLRLAARILCRDRMFALTAAVSLAIGIGANTAIFTVANALLFREPAGVVAPNRLVVMGSARGDGGVNPVSFDIYREVRRRARTLADVYGYHLSPRAMSLATSSAPASPERVFGHAVTPNYFSVLGAVAARGRFFDDADPPGEAFVVLSHGFWTRRFSADEGIVGRTVRLNGQLSTVVAVAPPEFAGTGVAKSDVWFPLRTDGGTRGSMVMGARLAPEMSIDQVAAELDVIARTLVLQEGSRATTRLRVMGSSRMAGNRNVVAAFGAALMVIVGLVLAVACANVAGILVSRATARRGEMAVRIAIGANRGHLVRQLLMETTLLFAVAGGLGLALGRILLATVSFLPVLPIPLAVSFPMDVWVLAFTTALSLVAAVLSGLVPAFAVARVDPLTSLKEDSKRASPRSRARRVFVVGQVAITLLLVVTTGLFIRVLHRAGSIEPGFDPNGVELASVDLSMGTYTDSTGPIFWKEFTERVRQVPGVRSATLARVPPGGFEGIGLGDVRLPGAVVNDDERIVPSWNIVATEYFTTLRIPLIRGRDFHGGDVAGSQPVAIVSQDLAHRLWRTDNAVGKFISVPAATAAGVFGERREVLVIGVAGDVKSSSLIDGLAGAFVYLPLQQNYTSIFTRQMTLMARANEPIADELRSIVAEMDQNLVVAGSSTLEESIALGLAPQRVVVWVAGTLGVVGLLLAAIGIYGVTADTVAGRTREIGVRVALGANRATILRMVLRQGAVLVAIGATIGLVLAAGVSHVLSAFLFDLPAIHPPTFVGAAVLFALIALVACYIPARRAARVDPLVALRYE